MKKKILTAAVMLAMGLTSFAAMDAEEYFEAANKAYHNGDYKTAVTYLKNAAALQPEESQFYFTMGMCYSAMGDYTNAEAAYLQAVKIQPNDFRSYLLLGDLREAQGRIPAAIDLWKKGTSFESVPESAQVFYSNAKTIYTAKIDKAIAAQNKTAPDAGKKSLNKITIKLTPEWHQAYFNGDKNKWIIEYGLNGEEVKSYKWTKLVTVNYFNGQTYNFNLDNYYNEFISSMKKHAAELNETLTVSPLASQTGEIWFEWSISGRNETELCRLFKQNGDLFFVHYAQKGAYLTPAEKNAAVEILKSVKAE